MMNMFNLWTGKTKLGLLLLLSTQTLTTFIVISNLSTIIENKVHPRLSQHSNKQTNTTTLCHKHNTSHTKCHSIILNVIHSSTDCQLSPD